MDLIVPQGPATNGGTPLPEDRLTNEGTAPVTDEIKIPAARKGVRPS